jgi:hypothetical protein
MNTDPQTGGRLVEIYDRPTLVSLGTRTVWGVKVGQYKIEAKTFDKLEEKVRHKTEDIALKIVQTDNEFERAHLRQLRADFQRAKTDLSIHRNMMLYGGYQT